VRAVLCLFVAIASLIPGAARAAARDLLVLNVGDQAIFSLRVGQAATSTWSGDLLAFNDVIGVSTGKTIHINYDDVVCAYDVKATLADGTTITLPQVNLCGIDQLRIGSQ
jgi:hypothetical protein